MAEVNGGYEKSEKCKDLKQEFPNIPNNLLTTHKIMGVYYVRVLTTLFSCTTLYSYVQTTVTTQLYTVFVFDCTVVLSCHWLMYGTSGKLMGHSINLIYDRIFRLSLPLDNTITVEMVFQFAFIDIFYFELDLLMLYDAT